MNLNSIPNTLSSNPENSLKRHASDEPMSQPASKRQQIMPINGILLGLQIFLPDLLKLIQEYTAPVPFPWQNKIFKQNESMTLQDYYSVQFGSMGSIIDTYNFIFITASYAEKLAPKHSVTIEFYGENRSDMQAFFQENGVSFCLADRRPMRIIQGLK